MLVKAKWNVKDASGWHAAGEVFETSTQLGNSVEVLVADKPKRQVQKEAPAAVNTPETAVEPERKPEAESARPVEKQRQYGKRRNSK